MANITFPSQRHTFPFKITGLLADVATAELVTVSYAGVETATSVTGVDADDLAKNIQNEIINVLTGLGFTVNNLVTASGTDNGTNFYLNLGEIDVIKPDGKNWGSIFLTTNKEIKDTNGESPIWASSVVAEANMPSAAINNSIAAYIAANGFLLPDSQQSQNLISQLTNSRP